MSFNYNKLLGKIKGRFAEAMGMLERALILKLHGKPSFKQNEIDKACPLLHLERSDIPDYFLPHKSRNLYISREANHMAKDF